MIAVRPVARLGSELQTVVAELDYRELIRGGGPIGHPGPEIGSRRRAMSLMIASPVIIGAIAAPISAP